MSNGWRSLAMVGLLLLLAGCQGAGETRNAGTKMNGGEPRATKEYRVLQSTPDRIVAVLPNRMIVVAQELRTSPVVSAQIWLQAGSAFEGEYAGTGVSHHLEHLVSGGTTTTRTEAESKLALSRMGAQVNAATSMDNVYYYINTTRDKSGEAIELLSDWVLRNAVDPKEYTREHQVIRNEFAMGRSQPNRIFWKLTQGARYPSHPAGYPTIGYYESFDALTREDAWAYYQRMYVPNNMVYVVTGDIDKEQVIEQVAKQCAEAEARDLPELALPTDVSVSEDRVVVGYAPVSRPSVRLLWPGTRLGAEHDYALDLLAGILGQVESSRLVQAVRNEKRLVNTIYASNYSTSWVDGFFYVHAEIALPSEANGVTTDQQALDATLDAVREQIELVCRQGVTEDELAMAKRQTKAYYVNSAQTAQGLASQLARNTISMRDPDYFKKYLAAIDKVTREEIRAAAKAMLCDRATITVKLLPVEEGYAATVFDQMPAQPDMAGRPTEVVSLDNRVLVEALARQAEAPGELRLAELGDVELHRLSNGLRVLVQRHTLVPSVAMEFYQLGGLLADEPGREGLAHATAMMQMRGTKSMSALELAREIEKLGAVMQTGSGNNTNYAQATCLKEDWSTVMGLLAEVVMEPSFPADEWEKLQPRLLATIKRQHDSIFTELRLQLREAYYGDHPWSQTAVGRYETIEGLKAGDLKQFHREHLGADGSVLAIFGDVEPREVVAQAEKLFGSMPAEAAKRSLTEDLPGSREAQAKQVKTTKPNSAAVSVALGPIPKRDHEDMAALRVLASVLDRFPSGRLTDQLRGEGKGLAYAVWAYPFMGMAKGHFEVGFNASPENLAEALARTMMTLHALGEKPVSEEELAAAKAAVLTREYLGMQSNSQRATSTALDELYGLGHNASERLLEQVQALTLEELRRVAEAYLKDPVAVIVTDKPLDEQSLERSVAGQLPGTE